MKKLSILVLFLLTTWIGQAQTAKLFGTVVDSSATGLSGATVVLLQAADSLMQTYAITSDDGGFFLKNVPSGDYVLQVTFLGYEQYSKALEVGDYDVPLGALELNASIKNLDEIVVKGEHVPILIKKDTIEYNAAAFDTPANAPVEELLKRLPGVQVDRNGNIKAQGENVQKILVDGKEFFSDDPKIATKNLPADAIEKIQVFDKKSDNEEFTGIDDGERAQTINLTLKEDRKQGYFGKLTAGYGTDDRYQIKGNVNRFSPSLQLSALGNMNTINEQGFSFEDYLSFIGGLGSLMSGSGEIRINSDDLPIGLGRSNRGLMDLGSGGLNVNYDFGNKTDLHLDYFYNYVQNDLRSEQFRQNFLEEGTTFNSITNSTQLNTNKNHRINLRFRQKADSMQNIQLNSSFGFNERAANQATTYELFNIQDELENTSANNYLSSADNWNWNAGLTYRRRLGRKGRSLVTSIQGELRKEQSDSDLNTTNIFFQPMNVDTLLQVQDIQNEQLNYNARISYLEPLGKQTSLQLSLEHQNYGEDYAKQFFDRVDRTLVRNTQLSNEFTKDYSYNNLGLRFKTSAKKLDLTLGLQARQSILEGTLANEQMPLQSDFFRLLPNMRLEYDFTPSKNIQFNYRTSFQEPSVEQLQPIVDNSNPLYTFIGNPSLKPEFSHRFGMRGMLYDQFSFISLFANIDFVYTQDKITHARAIDERFRQVVRPINIEQELDIRSDLSFSAPLRWMESEISLDLNARHNQTTLFINTTENLTNRLDASISAMLNNRRRDIIDIALSAELGYNNTTYDINQELNNDFLSQSYALDAFVNLGKQWKLASKLDYTIYSAEAFGERRTVSIWTASITHLFLENQRAEIKLAAFDLLNQNIGLERSSSFNYLQEERVNTLGRYLLLSFTYSLNKFGKTNPGMEVDFN